MAAYVEWSTESRGRAGGMRRGAAATVETPRCSAASHSTSRAPRPQRGGCGCGKMAVGKNKWISKGKKCGKKKT